MNNLTPTYFTIKGINFRSYKDTLLNGGLSSLRSVERLYQPLITLGNVSLIPVDNSNSYFVLKFSTIQERDDYRNYIFSIGEGRQFGNIKFPEILADYELGDIPYIFIKVSPYLEGPNDDAIFRGLPIDIEKIKNVGITLHSTVANL